MLKIKNERILVTGATGGIGQVIVDMLAEKGRIIGVHCNKNKEKAHNLIKIIEEKKCQGFFLQADLTKNEEAKRIVAEFAQGAGGVDVLINNAGGVTRQVNFLEVEDSDWEKVMAENLKTAYYMTREVYKIMVSQGWGKIINVSSVSVKYGGSENTMHYGASKAALESISRFFARNGAKHNILVNNIRAGYIETDLHKNLGRTSEQMASRIAMIPLQRPGKPSDVGEAVKYLVSSGGDFVTGETITVSGGD